MKRNCKSLTALFLAVLMLAAVLTVPVSAAWGTFTSCPKKVTVYLRKGYAEQTLKFKGEDMGYIDTPFVEGYDTSGDPAEVVRVTYGELKSPKKANGTYKVPLKFEAVQKGQAVVTLRMYDSNGEELAIKAFSVVVK